MTKGSGEAEERIIGELTELHKRIIELRQTLNKQTDEEMEHGLNKSQKAIEDIISNIKKAAEEGEEGTVDSHGREANLAMAIAREMGLGEEQISAIRMASLVHDIGETHVSSDVLNKSGWLTGSEFRMVKGHAQAGYNVLKAIGFPPLVAKIVLQHHERLDGSGYPWGLSGDKIILEARILAVADVVVAITSDRPYRKALSMDRALAEVSRYGGVFFDPQVVSVCLRLIADNDVKV